MITNSGNKGNTENDGPTRKLPEETSYSDPGVNMGEGKTPGSGSGYKGCVDKTPGAETELYAPSPLSDLGAGRVMSVCGVSPRKPSEVIAAAVSARRTGGGAGSPRTPGPVTRPTRAVKPINVGSKVDSGLARGTPARYSSSIALCCNQFRETIAQSYPLVVFVYSR